MAAQTGTETRRPAVAAPPATIPVGNLALGSDEFATASVDVDGDGAVGIKELEIAFAKLQAAFQRASAYVGEGDLRIARAKAALASNDARLAQLARTSPRTPEQERELQRLGAEREVIATDLQELEARKQAWQAQVDTARADAARLQEAAAQLTGGQGPDNDSAPAPASAGPDAPPADGAAEEAEASEAQGDAEAPVEGETRSAAASEPSQAAKAMQPQAAVPESAGAEAPEAPEAPEAMEEEEELAREESLQAPPPEAAVGQPQPGRTVAQPPSAVAQPPDAPVTATPEALVALQNALREAEEKMGVALAGVQARVRPGGEVVDGAVVSTDEGE